MLVDLATRRAELERLGFTILREDESSLVASRSKWHWECFLTKLTTIVLVRRVPTVTVDDMAADRRWLKTSVSQLDPSALPVGFQKARSFLAVYLADQPDPAAVHKCAERPKVELASFYVPAIVDGAGNATYYDKTAIFGGIYFPIFRFLLSRLCRPQEPPPASEPKSAPGLVLTFGCLGVFALMCLCPLVAIVADAL